MSLRQLPALVNFTSSAPAVTPLSYRFVTSRAHLIALSNSLPPPFCHAPYVPKIFGPHVHIPMLWETAFLPETIFIPTEHLGEDGTEKESLWGGRPPRVEGREDWERMWVGGQVVYENSMPLKTDSETEVTVNVEKVEWKVGKDGREGCYVTTRRRLFQFDDGADNTEYRIHLYRLPLTPPAPFSSNLDPHPTISPPSLSPPSDSPFLTFTPQPLHLLRFSFLTFNCHSIHLPTSSPCLVHAPLTQLLVGTTLIHHPAFRNQNLQSWKYRATSPLAVGREVGVWVHEQGRAEAWDLKGGKMVMAGEGKFASS